MQFYNFIKNFAGVRRLSNWQNRKRSMEFFLCIRSSHISISLINYLLQVWFQFSTPSSCSGIPLTPPFFNFSYTLWGFLIYTVPGSRRSYNDLIPKVTSTFLISPKFNYGNSANRELALRWSREFFLPTMLLSLFISLFFASCFTFGKTSTRFCFVFALSK